MCKTKNKTEVNRLRTRHSTREMRLFVLKCPISRLTERHDEEVQGEKMKTEEALMTVVYISKVKTRMTIKDLIKNPQE